MASNQQQQIRHPVQSSRSAHPSSMALSSATHTNSRTTVATQSVKRNSIYTEDPEYILPDSSMTEISLQVCELLFHVYSDYVSFTTQILL